MKIPVDRILIGTVQPLAGSAHASGIVKHPAAGPVWLGRLGLQGDAQADRKHHGGPDKALHHYAFEHYAFWRQALGERPLLEAPGAFGENISTQGMTEQNVCIGDIYTIGAATVQVTQSRQPCWKLNLRFDHPAMSRKVQQTGRTGWYYRVLEEGWIASGSTLALAERPHPQWPLARILDVLYCRTLDAHALESLLQLAGLPASWQKLFERRLSSRKVEDWSPRLDSRD